MLHLEIDQYPLDGIDVLGLWTEWDLFWGDGDAQRLARVVGEWVDADESQGAVPTFPSPVVLDGQELVAADAAGIRVLVLYGTAADCPEAFLT